MRAGIDWGHERLELEIAEGNLVPGVRAPIAANLADPAVALREALEHPLDYPALRLALTPDDHVAIVVDEGIPQLARLLTPILEHIRQAHVQPEAITLICPPSSSSQPWLDDLPDEFQDMHIEVHQPGDRKKLAYLATTKHERRVYLNRTAVDADQLVLLTRRGYDPVTGYAGAETALYPHLSDAATAAEFQAEFDADPPGPTPRRLQAEAREVSWLLGAPFFVQVIEGAGDGIAGVLAGPLESSDAGQRLLDARWRVQVSQAVDVVIAGVSGTGVGLDAVARAFFAASRIVRAGGSIVVLADTGAALGPSFDLMRRHDDPDSARQMLMQEKPSDLAAGYLWTGAASQARLYLLSGLADDVAEELFTIPLQHAEQVQRLLTGNTTCVLLPDADRTLAVLR